MMQKKTKTLLLILVFLAAIIIVFLLDNYFLKAIPFFRLSFLNPLFVLLGSFLGLPIYLLFLSLLFLYEKKKKFIPYLIIAAILALALSYLLKYIITRPRPEVIPLLIKSSPSLPSAHALVASSAFFFIRKLKPTQILAFILAFLTAFSGYYTGVHYLSDILIGILLGIFVSYLTFNKIPAIFKRVKQKLKSSIIKS